MQPESSRAGKRSNSNQEVDDSDLSSDDETSFQKINKQKEKVRIDFRASLYGISQRRFLRFISEESKTCDSIFVFVEKFQVLLDNRFKMMS